MNPRKVSIARLTYLEVQYVEEELEVVSSETVAEIVVWIYKILQILQDPIRDIQ